jgi:hypothetical protein
MTAADDPHGYHAQCGLHLARLGDAATAAITAARDAHAAALRRELHRFDTLTTALWTVHRDVAARLTRHGRSRLVHLRVSRFPARGLPVPGAAGGPHKPTESPT